MFDRTIWLLLVILERGDRVTRKDEPAFFHEMSELYRRHIPAGHTPPDEGKLAAKYRLIELDAYSTFARLRRINAQRIAARTKLVAATRRQGGSAVDCKV